MDLTFMASASLFYIPWGKVIAVSQLLVLMVLTVCYGKRIWPQHGTDEVVVHSLLPRLVQHPLTAIQGIHIVESM